METKTSNILMSAAEAISEYGWIRRAMGNERHGFCLLGALRFAACNAGWPMPWHWRPVRYLQEAAKTYDAVDWNDNRCESKEQAILTLIKAAELAEAAGQ